MISLPHQFDHFKVSYNTVKDKWSLNELISHCVQEEERLKQSKTESAHLATSYRGKRGKDKGKRILSEFAKGKRILPDSSRNVAGPSAKQFKKERSGSVCFFCKKDGHKKNDCEEYHAWRVKKEQDDTLVIPVPPPEQQHEEQPQPPQEHDEVVPLRRSTRSLFVKPLKALMLKSGSML
ncbi:hypothetical protein SASPL_143598 [Salvia splendens]|uniref:CCHC-type domain-containing protein n=1 Tax=Salvia splendens TaxID=180675 RepID=A0A8X8WMI1_SALSN|nr:hypothetical protein SASPL_143598 [Salvia splendens]